jgi:hypothetical protein
MSNNLNCPICEKEIYSGLGRGCKMCGMVLEEDDEFCCKDCIKKYEKINKAQGKILIKSYRRLK